MSIEYIHGLLDDLEEYKTDFDNQIMFMKTKGIKYPYDQTTRDVEAIYVVVKDNLNNLLSETPDFESLGNCNKAYLKRLRVIEKCLSLLRLALLYFVLFIFGKVNSGSDKILAVLCGIMGWVASNMIPDDLIERFAGPYEDNELLSQYYNMEDRRLSDKHDAELNMRTLVNLNKDLRKETKERKRIRKKKEKEVARTVISELKG